MSQTLLQPVQLLLQLAVIIAAARAAAFLARRVRQSNTVGEICAGLCLGPSLLGAIAPGAFATLFPAGGTAMLSLLSQAGLLLLMFQIGSEFNFSLLREPALRRSVGTIGAASLALPFAAGITFGFLGHAALAQNVPRTGFALLMGVAFAITALPVLGRIVMELGLERTRIGVVAIATAALNDLVGWLILGLVISLAMAKFDALVFLKTAGAFGIFAIFGGLLAGLCAHAIGIVREGRNSRIGVILSAFFMPIFFTYTGLRTDIGTLHSQAWLWFIALLAVAMASKLAAGYFAARRVGFGKTDASAMGVMMNTRGLMELVVANVGFDLGLFPPAVFTMLVLMALLSTLITTPALLVLLKGVIRAERSVTESRALRSAAGE